MLVRGTAWSAGTAAFDPRVTGREAGRYEVRGHVVVWAKGEIDLMTAPALRRELTEAVGRDSAHVIVDLTDVWFMDSSGVHALTDAHDAAQAGGGDLCLVGVSGTVRRVLDILGLDRLFPLHPTIQVALSGNQAQ